MNNFILPEYWCVKVVNDDEDYQLTKYINKLNDSNIGYGIGIHKQVWFSNKVINLKFKHYYHYDEFKPNNDSIEITYQQFLKYVLNQNIDILEEQPEDNTELNEILIKLLTE